MNTFGRMKILWIVSFSLDVGMEGHHLTGLFC